MDVSIQVKRGDSPQLLRNFGFLSIVIFYTSERWCLGWPAVPGGEITREMRYAGWNYRPVSRFRPGARVVSTPAAFSACPAPV